MKTHFYDLRFRSYEWARVWITSDGMISICSDYGNFGYWFGSPAKEIRRFLVRCDPGPGGYIAIKLSDGKRVFDGDATERQVKKHIISYRREKEWTREQARAEWELLREHSHFSNELDFYEWQSATKIDCPHEFYQDTLPGCVRGFMEHAWPVLVAAMEKEIALEDAHEKAFGVMQEMGV